MKLSMLIRPVNKDNQFFEKVFFSKALETQRSKKAQKEIEQLV